MSASMPFRYIRKKELCTFLGISRATLERYIATGDFPRPYPLGKRIVAWRSDEVMAHTSALPRMEDAYACRNRS